jgi:trehalose 6-phosphate phosphatase
MSVELHPPIDADKGTAVRSLADGAAAVLYAGDDVGDLPAFAALAELRAAGITTASVAVGGSELPDEVAAAVDLVLDAPADLVGLLGALAPDRGTDHPS